MGIPNKIEIFSIYTCLTATESVSWQFSWSASCHHISIEILQKCALSNLVHAYLLKQQPDCD